MANCIKDRIIALDTATPRYTSYPSAPLFEQGFSEDTYRKWLNSVDNDAAISLYIHIPFCNRLCYYCGCNTNVTNNYELIRHYLDFVRKELYLLSKMLGDRKKVTHLHFGGGSPTILRPYDFSTLMDSIGLYFSFSDQCEIAIEADPRHMSEDRIEAYAAAGVNRISLGVQDIDENVMANVNRPQPFDLTENAIDTCKKYGIRHFNIDLMYGLPGQNVESVSKTVETVSALHPDRISFFGYAHVPWMKRNMTMLDGKPLPDPSERYDLYEHGSDILKEKGYLPIGIDHFVRPSDSMAKALGNRQLKRNFQGYTTDTAQTLLGVGSSAIGRMEQGYIQNTADLRHYQQSIHDNHLPVHKGIPICPEDAVHGDVINEIMCYMAVDLADMTQKYNLAPDYFDDCLSRLSPLLEQDLIQQEGTFLRVLHPHAARLTARAFDQAAARSTAYPARHSKTV